MAMTTEEIRALPAVVTIKEASKALGISLDSAYQAAHSGELPVIAIGRRMLVPKQKLLEMLSLDEAHATPAA